MKEQDNTREPALLSRRDALAGILCGASLFWIPGPVQAEEATRIKFACVAPEGSLWVNLTREWDRELRSRSNNRARFQIFAGGVLGEELDAIRKMRAGQVHATGVTSVGMGELAPASRVLELPQLFRSPAELDAVVTELDAAFKDLFDKRGYVLLGFTEVGPIHLFTRKPIRKVSDLDKLRLWVWEGDPLSSAIAKAFQVSGVPLSLLNVLPSLQTGVIDGVYGSPLAAVTMQWQNYLKFQLAEPLSYAVGAIAVDKRAFQSLPADIQALQLELGKKYTRQMVLKSRVENDQALQLILRAGVQQTRLDPAEVPGYVQKLTSVWPMLKGSVYPEELLGKVLAITTRLRQGSK